MILADFTASAECISSGYWWPSERSQKHSSQARLLVSWAAACAPALAVCCRHFVQTMWSPPASSISAAADAESDGT